MLYSGSEVAWCSNTTGNPGAHLEFQSSDGNLVLYAAGTTALWSTGPKSGAAEVVLQDNCDLITYSRSGAALWFLGTSCR